MSFFNTNSNLILNSPPFTLFDHFESSNIRPKSEQENLYISKKSNYIYENLNESENDFFNFNLSTEFKGLELTKKFYNDSNLSDFNFNLSYNNWYEGSIIQKEKKSELSKSNEIKNQTKFLNKKRNIKTEIFEVKHRNHFSAFTPSDYNNDLRKLINETINESKNGKLEMYTSTKESEDSEDQEKQHRKKKKIRKYDVDNIRKKVKSRFLRSLKIYSNQKLKDIKSTKLFKNLPGKFVNNVNKKYNSSILYKKYEEILSKSFDDGNNENNSYLKITEHNKSVLKYLKNKKKLNDLKFINMTYFELYKEYFKSKEFENEIAGLIEKKEKLIYIKKFIIIASNFINFFSN